jgi:probable addiction module antidote protein
MTKSEYRSFNQVEEEYYRNHPNEIDSYLTTCFEEYAEDGCIPALLASLRMIARIKGLSATAGVAGLSRKEMQKALSEQVNPGFESISAIIQAMGYRLVPEKREVPHVE